MEFRLRPANVGDAAALAQVHVTSWRESYGGLLPYDMLARLSVETRTRMWQRILGHAPARSATRAILAEDDAGVVGFGSFGPQRWRRLADGGFDGEIGALYILRSAQRHGVGTGLMRAMGNALQRRGHRAISLWVLRQNTPARRFYSALGGSVVDQKVEADSGVVLIELAYGWRDVAALVG